jgi:hypothetical protein
VAEFFNTIGLFWTFSIKQDGVTEDAVIDVFWVISRCAASWPKPVVVNAGFKIQ